MSRLFGANTTDKDDRGSGSSIDDIPVAGDMTVLARVYRTATGTNQFIVTKRASGLGWYIQMDDSLDVGGIACQVGRTGGDAFRVTSGSGNAVPVNTWYDIGFTWQSTDSPVTRIYLVPSGGLPVEASAYDGSSGNGSGVVDTDAANNLWIGNLQTTGVNPFKGRIELVGVFPSKLTPAQMQQWFAKPGPMFGCVMAALEGFNPSGTEPDLSGNGNSGTVTGATVADNAPLRRRWGGRSIVSPYVVSSAGFSVSPTGVSSTAALGTPTTSMAAHIAPVGVSSAAALGTPQIAVTYTPTSWADSFNATNQTSYYYTSPFARVAFTTDATSVVVTHYRSLDAAYDTQAGIGVIVDGTYNQRIAAATQGLSSTTITLPAGTKTVEFVNGTTSRPSTIPAEGTWLVSVALIGGGVPSTVTETANPILFVGASVSIGFLASDVPQNAWVMQVRRARAESVMVDGYGGNRLSYFGVDSTARAASAARLAEMAADPKLIWIALGFGDYSNATMSAATFATTMGDTLDTLRAAFPTTQFVVQSPTITTGNEGGTLPAFRTACATACTGRHFAKFVDGTTLVTTGELDGDGVHLTTAGQTVMATAVLAILNGLFAGLDGVSSTAALGTPAVSMGMGAAPVGVSSTAALGTPAISAGLSNAPTGVASTAALGTPAVSMGLGAAPTGVASTAALGTPSPSFGGGLSASPTGVASTAALGTPAASFGLSAAPIGVASTTALGSPSASFGIGTAPAGISSAGTLGTPTVTMGMSASPTGVASTGSLGSPTPSFGGGLSLSPIGVESVAALGTPTVSFTAGATPTGVTSTGALGVPAVSMGATFTVVGLSSVGAVGVPTLTAGPAPVRIYRATIRGGHAFGVTLRGGHALGATIRGDN